MLRADWAQDLVLWAGKGTQVHHPWRKAPTSARRLGLVGEALQNSAPIQSDMQMEDDRPSIFVALLMQLPRVVKDVHFAGGQNHDSQGVAK